MRKNYRINIGISYMFPVLFHTARHQGEDRETMRAAGQQMSKVIAYDAYAAGGKIYLMKYWIPGAIAVGILNGFARHYLPRMAPSLARVALGTLVVVVFAFLLFLLKQQQQIVYGSVELVFALWSCEFSLSRMTDALTAPVVVGLFTSIYLMIRAADNITMGVEQYRAKRKSVLATLKQLSKLGEVKKYRVWFAAIVWSKGELFLTQTEFYKDKPLIYSRPPIDRNAKYAGILFAAGDAEKLWSVNEPKTEIKTFSGSELKIVDGSDRVFMNPDPSNQIDTAPPPEPQPASTA